MGKLITWIIIIGLVVWGIFALTSNTVSDVDVDEEITEELAIDDDANNEDDTIVESIHVEITYSDAGFSPKSVSIKKGDTVEFHNESDGEMWPASAKHPTHTVYPGSGIEKCDAQADSGTLLDACTKIASGDSWSFVFNEVGEWFYHNHLKSSDFGSVVVE